MFLKSKTRYVLRTRYVPSELDMLPFGNEKRTDEVE